MLRPSWPAHHFDAPYVNGHPIAQFRAAAEPPKIDDHELEEGEEKRVGEICVIELRVVLHRNANYATSAPVTG